jgi:SAM-dependent methyltransferase
VKEERLTSILQRAREKTEVSKRIPKLLRRLFRKQGGYNKLLLESVAVLTKTNVELNKRLQELAGARDADAAWMRAAATIIASVPRHRESVLAATNALAEQINTLEQRNAATDEQLDVMRAQSAHMGEHLRNAQSELDGMTGLRRDFDRAGERVESIEQRQTSDAAFIKAELSHQAALLQSWLAGAQDGRPAGRRRQPGKILPATPDDHQLDAFYLSFENRFRGPRNDIKKRVRFYLPFLRKARAGTKARPVLDVGCGRGEWLELLREGKLEAIGIDLNEAMVAQCKERGLKVVQGDAIEFLRKLPDRSQGAVTGFHIIEHLPLEVLIQLLMHSRRVLKPGGIAIFESPNCKNLMVGACNFNIDPTHRNPVFPETAQFMLETQGFEGVRLEYLSPVDITPLGNIDEESPRIRELLYGPQDFAVIGYAPAAE